MVFAVDQAEKSNWNKEESQILLEEAKNIVWRPWGKGSSMLRSEDEVKYAVMKLSKWFDTTELVEIQSAVGDLRR